MSALMFLYCIRQVAMELYIMEYVLHGLTKLGRAKAYIAMLERKLAFISYFVLWDY